MDGMSWVILNLTYILIGAQYLVRDMLLLRGLAISASICSIITMFNKEIYNIVYWNLFFLAINVVQLTLLILERRPVAFTPEEEELRMTVFSPLQPLDLRLLLDQAEWRDGNPQELLVQENEILDRLILLVSGRAVVKVRGKVVGEVKDHYFIGEMSYLTGAPATANVEITLPARYLVWDQEKLKAFLDTRGALRYGFQGVLGADLTRKIRKADGLQTSAGTIPLSEITNAG